MIWSIISKYQYLSKCDKEDIKQEVLIFLWEKIIPVYDYERAHAKFSSFAYRCIVNFVNRRIQKMNRLYSYKENAAHIYYEIQDERVSKNVLIAKEKAKFFEDLVKEDKIKLKPKEKIVLNIIIDNPDITQREISERLGYKHPSAISMMLLRLRRRLAKSTILKKNDIIHE
jgi:DNA-directed RNA polymerase specialized sigma24 family protein